MSFFDSMLRLLDAANQRQRGIESDRCVIDRRDLAALIEDHERLDGLVRMTADTVRGWLGDKAP